MEVVHAGCYVHEAAVDGHLQGMHGTLQRLRQGRLMAPAGPGECCSSRTRLGLPVSGSWNVPFEMAMSRLPLAQNSEISHVSCGRQQPRLSAMHEHSYNMCHRMHAQHLQPNACTLHTWTLSRLCRDFGAPGGFQGLDSGHSWAASSWPAVLEMTEYVMSCTGTQGACWAFTRCA